MPKKPSPPEQVGVKDFEELVRKYEKRLYFLAYHFMGNHEQAEELSQEAFLRAYLALPRFRGESQLYTWLYRILVNLCIDAKRKKKLPEVPMEDLPLGREINTDQREDIVMIREALEQLPPPFRSYLILHDLDGFSYREIAQIFRCPVGTVMSRMNAARQRLRAIIENKYPDLLPHKGAR